MHRWVHLIRVQQRNESIMWRRWINAAFPIEVAFITLFLPQKFCPCHIRSNSNLTKWSVELNLVNTYHTECVCSTAVWAKARTEVQMILQVFCGCAVVHLILQIQTPLEFSSESFFSFVQHHFQSVSVVFVCCPMLRPCWCSRISLFMVVMCVCVSGVEISVDKNIAQCCDRELCSL